VVSHAKCRYGQLGIGNTENCSVPTLIAKLQLLNVNVIAAGYHHSMCITGDGDACVGVRDVFIAGFAYCYQVTCVMQCAAGTPGATAGTAL
jgi:alpha-tubulin suppressor-like RCC1 family protein